MPEFKITAQNFETQEKKILLYNTDVSTLKWEDGTDVLDNCRPADPESKKKKTSFQKGKRNLENIKIQLGLSCNFECEYCSQRFVPRADETNPSFVQDFVDNMGNWYKGSGKVHFEFWGGEPLVYWKTLKPLATKLHKKYPKATMSIITNGSLFNKQIVDFLTEHAFSVSISHDGPGQFVRGPDPLDDPKSKKWILELYKVLGPRNAISFNPMVNAKNISRASIQEFFVSLIKDNLGEEYVQYLRLGEGGFVDAYDEGGLENSLLDEKQDIEYRNFSAAEARMKDVSRFGIFENKSKDFFFSIMDGDRMDDLGQKCGMERENQMAIDLNGNVLTCQNVSAVSNNPAGKSHLIGHVNNLEDVEVTSGTHWSDREECPKCPVVHLCKGACLFLSGQLWEASCNNSYSDNIIYFCNTIESLTGYFPIYIDGPHKKDRHDLFWIVNGEPEKLRKPKKVINIQAV